MGILHGIISKPCRKIVGLVFFVAGILKLMDPVGTGLIITEYFKLVHIDILLDAAKIMGLIFSFVETILGVALITGVFRRISRYVATFLIAVFTLITVYLWYKNPAMDCGCFGEAIHLTHLQTLIKNIVLCFLAVGLFMECKSCVEKRVTKFGVFILMFISVCVFSIYSYRNIPLVDFTPFNTSSMLEAAVQDTSAKSNEYVSSFIYEKNGQKGVFTLDRLPDSTWTFVKSVVLKKSDNIREKDYPILSFRNAEGNYCDKLAIEDNVLVISVYNPEAISKTRWEKIKEFAGYSSRAGMKVLLLVADDKSGMQRTFRQIGLSDSIVDTLNRYMYYSDYKTLISLNRANGGAVYFDDGNLIEKWSDRALPSESRVERLVKNDATDVMLSSSTKGLLSFEAFMLYSLVLMFLF